jgi:hypothetical protein
MTNLSDKIIVKLELHPNVAVRDAFQVIGKLIKTENPTNGVYTRGGDLYCIGDKEIFGELFQGKFWYNNTVGRWFALEGLTIPQSLENYVKNVNVVDY